MWRPTLRVVPAVGEPIWDNLPVDLYASNKISLTVHLVLFGTQLVINCPRTFLLIL
jgi:hypothetical protein